jgi:hypothetical protein
MATRAYRLVAGNDEEWFDDLATAHTAIAARLSAADAEALRTRISTDPIVVRRADARWRSAGAWLYRSPAATVRLFEMVRVDEAAYDH